MSDNLTIFGTDYTGVTGIKAKSTGNGTLTYVRPTGTKSITENGTAIDVTQYANVDVDVSTGPDWPTFTSNNEGTTITCDKTYAECRALIQDGVTGAFAQSDSLSAVLIALRVNAANEDLHYIYVDNGVPVTQLNYASDGTITTQDSADSVTTLDVIQNGTYSDGLWNKVEVNVPAPAPKLQSKTAIPTEQQQIVLPDSDYHYDGLSSVTVNAIPSTYVGSGITRRSSEDITNEDNFIFTIPAGYYNEDASCWPSNAVLSWDEPSVDSYNNIRTEIRATTPGYIAGINYDTFTLPNYVGNNITRRSSTDLTASGATVTVPAGYYASQASKAVTSGTEGTPTATKGTVNNNTMSITPSVTNSAGYITGSTKTGTPVTISASELVSGSQTITENGTVNVTNLAEVVVNIDTSSKYTATIGTLGAHQSYIKYNNVIYSANSSFEFSAGDSCTITAYGEMTGSNIYENGTKIGESDSGVIYTYVLPSCDIEIVSSSTGGGARVDITREDFVSLQSKTATPTMSQQVITADSGYDGLSQVTISAMPSGTAGTPTATKGTVSNHSVSVTPSVTNTTGYITGDTKTGTAVTVSASELVSGTKSITENGTAIDVTQYSNVDVNVPGMSETDLKNLIEGSNSFVDIDWPDGLSDIRAGAFMSCDYFNPSSLPSGVTQIGERAFAGCSNLAITSLPNSITTIESYAFLNCSQLALTNLPNSITTIKPYTFSGCRSLALTSLPDELTSISGYAFYECSNLALTSLPSGVTEIGPYAFDNCQKLALANIPNSVTTIGGWAFGYCHSLTITRLPSNLNSIGASAFLGCDNLTTLSCDGVITMLGGNAFTGDSSHQMQLTSASFPNMALTSSLPAVFGSTTAANACQLLKFCDIGSTGNITWNAFANCYALKTLVLRKTDAVCTLSNVNAFTNTPMSGYNNLTGKVYVPSALISAYQTAANWKTLYNAGTVTFVAIEGSVYER